LTITKLEDKEKFLSFDGVYREMKKAQTEPIKTKAKALDLNFPEPKKRK